MIINKINKHKTAFSMIELMVSILVIAVIAASFAPVVSKKLASMNTIAGSHASLTRNCCGNTDCKLCYRGSSGCSCMDCRKECEDNQYVNHAACECKNCNDTENGGIENCFSCHQDWFSGKLSCNQCMPGYKLDASGTACITDTIETTHVGNTVWTTRNAGDTGGPAFQWGDGTNNTVKRCVVGKECNVPDGTPACWVGQTSSSCTRNSSYSGCNRTVCNWAAANLICAQNGLSIPTGAQYQTLTKGPDNAHQYVAPNTLFCNRDKDVPKCTSNSDGCIGAQNGTCTPCGQWSTEASVNSPNAIVYLLINESNTLFPFLNFYKNSAVSVRCARDCSGFGDCLNCTNAGCLECAKGSYLNGTTCTLCSDTFGESCGECTKDGCSICAEGYFRKNGVCVACNDGSNGWGTACGICTNEGCTQCSGNYYIETEGGNKGKCVSCAARWGDKCSACNASGCTQCVDNYYINDGYCTACTTTWGDKCSYCTSSSCTQCSEDNYYIETSGGDKGKCLACADKWGEKCSKCTASSCTQCSEDNYYIETSGGDKGKCLACPTKWGSACTRCNASTCTQCTNNSYYIETASGSNKGKCIACSPKWGTPCATCTISGCSTCNGACYINSSNGMAELCTTTWGSQCTACTASGCSTCSGNYYVNSGGQCKPCTDWNSNATCTACKSSGCTSCDGVCYIDGGYSKLCTNWGATCAACTASGCSNCGGGYYTNASGQCIPCTDFNASCTSCTSSGCSECSTGTYLNSSGGCTACTTFSGACTSCTSSGCNECASGYHVSGTGCASNCAEGHPSGCNSRCSYKTYEFDCCTNSTCSSLCSSQGAGLPSYSDASANGWGAGRCVNITNGQAYCSSNSGPTGAGSYNLYCHCKC